MQAHIPGTKEHGHLKPLHQGMRLNRFILKLDFAQRPITLCPHMASGYVLHCAAAGKGHGQLQLILQFVNDSLHPIFSL